MLFDSFRRCLRRLKDSNVGVLVVWVTCSRAFRRSEVVISSGWVILWVGMFFFGSGEEGFCVFDIIVFVVLVWFLMFFCSYFVVG